MRRLIFIATSRENLIFVHISHCFLVIGKNRIPKEQIKIKICYHIILLYCFLSFCSLNISPPLIRDHQKFARPSMGINVPPTY